jgi:hypothetical protein
VNGSRDAIVAEAGQIDFATDQLGSDFVLGRARQKLGMTEACQEKAGYDSEEGKPKRSSARCANSRDLHSRFDAGSRLSV